MEKLLDTIDTINEYVGKVFRWSLVALAAVMVFEVFSRYVFHKPTTWAFEVSTGFYGMTFMMCGAYALLYKSHVTIDILYEKFGPKGRSIFDIVGSLIFLYPFFIVVFLEGIKYAGHSWAIKETSWSTFPMPLYLVKTMIPIFAFLMLLQGSATFIRAICFLTTGKEYVSKYKKEEIPKVVMDSYEPVGVTSGAKEELNG